jgi:phosphomevalonate kinase
MPDQQQYHITSCNTVGPSGEVIVNKTGMGSSAALTTSLVGALLQWFGVIKLGAQKDDKCRMTVHNLSQLAHAVAQGKLGSGFDVAAAVYGKCKATNDTEIAITTVRQTVTFVTFPSSAVRVRTLKS